MKIRYLIVFMMFAFAVVYPQTKDDIVLPKGGREIKENKTFQNVNFYVTKEQVVFVEEGVNLKYFTNIAQLLFALREVSPPDIWILPTLYADADTRFDFIQQIIRQMALVEFKIEFVTQENKSIYKDNSTLLKMDKSEIQRLIPEEEQGEYLSDFYSIVPPPAPWWYIARMDMYSGNAKKMKSVLSEHKYAIIKALSNQKIEYEGKVLFETKMADLLKENEILFIRFDENLLYKDYIYTIDFINQVAKKVEAVKGSSAYPIEIFSELEEFITENDIKI